MKERDAVRAILLTPEHEILLLQITAPGQHESFWATPGGGALAGESPEDTLRRELFEELRLTSFVIGPLVWRRHHTFQWGAQRLSQREQFYIVHTARFEPQMHDQKEAAYIKSLRWWRAAELSHAKERLAPSSLATIIDNFLCFGAPPSIEVEIVSD